MEMDGQKYTPVTSCLAHTKQLALCAHQLLSLFSPASHRLLIFHR
jgi:hypothetical protein